MTLRAKIASLEEEKRALETECRVLREVILLMSLPVFSELVEGGAVELLRAIAEDLDKRAATLRSAAETAKAQS